MKSSYVFMLYFDIVLGILHSAQIKPGLQERGVHNLLPRTRTRSKSLSSYKTPRRQRSESPPRSRSAPPARGEQYPRTATAQAILQGTGRIITVEERNGRPAKLTPTDIDTKGAGKVKGNYAAVTGMNFNAQGHIRTFASGSAKVFSSISTRTGGSGYITAEAPGQAAVHVRVRGDAHAEVTLPNRYPDLGHARVESVIWGKGTSTSRAHGFGRRDLHSMSITLQLETDAFMR